MKVTSNFILVRCDRALKTTFVDVDARWGINSIVHIATQSKYVILSHNSIRDCYCILVVWTVEWDVNRLSFGQMSEKKSQMESFEHMWGMEVLVAAITITVNRVNGFSTTTYSIIQLQQSAFTISADLEENSWQWAAPGNHFILYFVIYIYTNPSLVQWVPCKWNRVIGWVEQEKSKMNSLKFEKISPSPIDSQFSHVSGAGKEVIEIDNETFVWPFENCSVTLFRLKTRQRHSRAISVGISQISYDIKFICPFFALPTTDTYVSKSCPHHNKTTIIIMIITIAIIPESRFSYDGLM